MAGYNDTKELIIKTLGGRPSGYEIQPEEHQSYALNMLDYVRSVEMISNSSIIGIAKENTSPVQPSDTNVSYIAGVGQNRNAIFKKFIDEEGKPITISTGEMQGVLVVLMWNTSNWSYVSFETNVISQSEVANFYYNYNVRKTYDSVDSLFSDSFSPIGDDGRAVKNGDLVTVVNPIDDTQNGFYSRVGNGWKLQSGFNFEVTQEEGDDVNRTMSQKAITESLALKLSQEQVEEAMESKLVFLSEAEYSALEVKDENKYYYVYEE